jgi:uncharacterized protein YjbJ (UPF0337 family)
MDENRVEGTARNLGGKVQEGVGRVTGNAQTPVEGLANQAAGTAKIFMVKRPIPRVRPQQRSIAGSATQSKASHMRAP